MKLIYSEDGTIAPLAYCVRAKGRRVDVVHGSQVECHPDFFCDGVWAGGLLEGRLDEGFLSGTGGRLVGGALRLVAPEVPLDRIILVESEGAVIASNSLPFLLEVIEDRLDPDHLWYRTTVMAAERGVRTAPRTLPTEGGRTLRILMSERADIDAAGTVTTQLTRVAPKVLDYADYRHRLRTTVSAVLANATDPARRRPLVPVAALSTGYDSCAVTALCVEAGLDSALTMLRRDPTDPAHLLDHPAEVAEALGLSLDEVERDRWRERTDLPEAEIAATATTFMDVVLLTLEDRLPGRLLIVGNSGDNVWGLGNYRTATDVVQGFGNLSGRGLAEHRLRVGYVTFSPAAIDHTAHPSIFQLSRSPEMAPWSIGGSYDRPIPRRIVEEAGVPRGAFAVTKFAGSARVGSSVSAYRMGPRRQMEDDLAEVMTVAARASFLDHVEAVDPSRHRRQLRRGALAHRAYVRLDNLNHRVGRRLHGRGVTGIVPRAVMARLATRGQLHADHTYLLPHWGTETLKPRYRSAAALLRPRGDGSCADAPRAPDGNRPTVGNVDRS